MREDKISKNLDLSTKMFSLHEILQIMQKAYIKSQRYLQHQTLVHRHVEPATSIQG